MSGADPLSSFFFFLDPVFGLLGAAAAAGGLGTFTGGADCLQAATADGKSLSSLDFLCLVSFADLSLLLFVSFSVAFTNAKAAGDVAGMTTALQYRTLERNTGGKPFLHRRRSVVEASFVDVFPFFSAVGLASVLCTAFTPVNAEVAALAQHQDPASDGAAASNKALVLELAKQINSVRRVSFSSLFLSFSSSFTTSSVRSDWRKSSGSSRDWNLRSW